MRDSRAPRHLSNTAPDVHRIGLRPLGPLLRRLLLRVPKAFRVPEEATPGRSPRHPPPYPPTRGQEVPPASGLDTHSHKPKQHEQAHHPGSSDCAADHPPLIAQPQAGRPHLAPHPPPLILPPPPPQSSRAASPAPSQRGTKRRSRGNPPRPDSRTPAHHRPPDLPSCPASVSKEAHPCPAATSPAGASSSSAATSSSSAGRPTAAFLLLPPLHLHAAVPSGGPRRRAAASPAAAAHRALAAAAAAEDRPFSVAQQSDSRRGSPSIPPPAR